MALKLGLIDEPYMSCKYELGKSVIDRDYDGNVSVAMSEKTRDIVERTHSNAIFGGRFKECTPLMLHHGKPYANSKGVLVYGIEMEIVDFDTERLEANID